jgi:rod shape determining protein RodA
VRPEITPRFYRASGDSAAHRLLGRMDWPLFAAVLALSLTGLFFIYSATAQSGGGPGFLARQSAALVLGLAGMAVCVVVPYQVLSTYARGIFWTSIGVLLLLLVFGVRLRGSRSWFHFHWFYFQPVELTRLALVVAMAAYADERFREMRDWRGLLVPFAMTGLHIGLVLLQPDLSSVIVLAPMTLAVLYSAGAPGGTLVAVVAVGAIALGIPLGDTFFSSVGDRFADSRTLGWLKRAFTETVPFFQLWGGVCAALGLGWWFLRKWRIAISGLGLVVALAVVVAGVGGSFGVKHALKDYQKKRLIAFIDPTLDPLSAGYNILQSEIAVGSGRVFGKGYLSGSQSQLGFLPERHTDFIYSVLAEEKGFAGAVFVLGLYFFVVWRAFDIAAAARDRFGRFLAVALGTFLGFSGLVNIGMVMGLMPVTGLPLPFLSYGGSALVGSFLAVGLLQSIHLRRYIL